MRIFGFALFLEHLLIHLLFVQLLIGCHIEVIYYVCDISNPICVSSLTYLLLITCVVSWLGSIVALRLVPLEVRVHRVTCCVIALAVVHFSISTWLLFGSFLIFFGRLRIVTIDSL